MDDGNRGRLHRQPSMLRSKFEWCGANTALPCRFPRKSEEGETNNGKQHARQFAHTLPHGGHKLRRSAEITS